MEFQLFIEGLIKEGKVSIKGELSAFEADDFEVVRNLLLHIMKKISLN